MLNSKSLIIILLVLIQSCEFSQKDYFPSTYGLKWVYSVAIKSSYTGKSSNKRIMITNFHQSKKNKVEEFSKLYSDGSYYSYAIKDDYNTTILFITCQIVLLHSQTEHNIR